MKRFLCILFSILLCSCLIFPVSAENSAETEPVTLGVFPGYVHHVAENGIITSECNASAARDTLRYAAGLEEFDDYQKKAADVNFDGEVTAVDARILLRYTAGLSGFPVTLHVGQEFRFGPFTAWWTLECLTESSDECKIEREVIPMPEDSKPGDNASYVLHVTPTEPGEYTVEVIYLGYTNEIEKTARFDITCIE